MENENNLILKFKIQSIDIFKKFYFTFKYFPNGNESEVQRKLISENNEISDHIKSIMQNIDLNSNNKFNILYEISWGEHKYCYHTKKYIYHDLHDFRLSNLDAKTMQEEMLKLQQKLEMIFGQELKRFDVKNKSIARQIDLPVTPTSPSKKRRIA